jgi:retron-type reverse transcriptase
LFKGEDQEKCGNYRPISVLPVFSKLFEKVVNSRLVSFLNKKKFFYPHQYGFRKSSDTCSAATDTICEIQSGIDRGKKCALVSLDLRKAFDTVDHDILLLKLERLGVRGVCNNLFRSYLLDRTQCVCVNGVQSGRGVVSCGVPQGSILGPTLFLIYVNSMSGLNLAGRLRLYADDSLLIYLDNDYEIIKRKIASDLDLLSNWLDTHKLTLN